MDQEVLGEMNTDLIVFAVLFGALAAVAMIRLIKGPTGADRMVAGDVADTLVCCAMILFALYSGRGIYLDIAIIGAMLGIVDTMLVGRFLEKGRREKHADVAEDSQ